MLQTSFLLEGLIKQALLGTAKQEFTSESVTEPLRPAVEQIKASATSAENAFLKSTALVQSYEQASYKLEKNSLSFEQSNDTSSQSAESLANQGPIPVKPLDFDASQFLSYELSLNFDGIGADVVLWLYMLQKLCPISKEAAQNIQEQDAKNPEASAQAHFLSVQKLQEASSREPLKYFRTNATLKHLNTLKDILTSKQALNQDIAYSSYAYTYGYQSTLYDIQRRTLMSLEINKLFTKSSKPALDLLKEFEEYDLSCLETVNEKEILYYWNIATESQRKRLLKLMRLLSPHGAIRMLSKDFAKNSADLRATLVGYLMYNLSEYDLPILEQMYDNDRSLKVRQAMIPLLSRFSDSKLTHYLQEFVLQNMHYDKATHKWTFDKFTYDKQLSKLDIYGVSTDKAVPDEVFTLFSIYKTLPFKSLCLVLGLDITKDEERRAALETYLLHPPFASWESKLHAEEAFINNLSSQEPKLVQEFVELAIEKDALTTTNVKLIAYQSYEYLKNYFAKIDSQKNLLTSIKFNYNHIPNDINTKDEAYAQWLYQQHLTTLRHFTYSVNSTSDTSSYLAIALPDEAIAQAQEKLLALNEDSAKKEEQIQQLRENADAKERITNKFKMQVIKLSDIISANNNVRNFINDVVQKRKFLVRLEQELAQELASAKQVGSEP